MAKAAGTFKRGTNAGTFTCRVCGDVRQRAQDNDVDLCNLCYDESGMINSHDDGHHDTQSDDQCPYCTGAAERGSAEWKANRVVSKGREIAKVAKRRMRAGEFATYQEAVDAAADGVDAGETSTAILVGGATGTCLCGCGGSPRGKKSRFLPGHDARYHAAIKRAEADVPPPAPAKKVRQPRTPQVDALPGVTPLGISSAKGGRA